MKVYGFSAMATTTTSFFGPDFVKELIPWLLQIFGEATAHAYRIIWDEGIQLLLQYLYDESDTVSIDEAIADAKKRWPK